MTAVQLFALALLIGPFVGCGWAWVQWQREEARRLAAASDQLRGRAAAALERLGAEPDVDREEPLPGQWQQPPVCKHPGVVPTVESGRHVERCASCGVDVTVITHPLPTRPSPMRDPELRREICAHPRGITCPVCWERGRGLGALPPPDRSWVTTETISGRVAPYPPRYDRMLRFEVPWTERVWH